MFERFRRIVMGARLIACTGKLQIQGEVIHVVTERLQDLDPGLAAIGAAAAPAQRRDCRCRAMISTKPSTSG